MPVLTGGRGRTEPRCPAAESPAGVAQTRWISLLVGCASLVRPRPGSHIPVAPSTSSRRRSAWPLWRAYSSIMCTMIQRSESPWVPARAASLSDSRPDSSSEAAAATSLPAPPDLRAARRRAPRRDRARGRGRNRRPSPPGGRGARQAGEHPLEPVPFDLGQMLDESEQRHLRGRRRGEAYLLVVEALALEGECGAVEVEPGAQHGAFVGMRGRYEAAVRCSRHVLHPRTGARWAARNTGGREIADDH